MALDHGRVQEAEQRLAELLGPEIAQVTAAIRTSLDNNDHPFLIKLPEADLIDEPLENLASLVARSANAYMRAARFAGMAKAEAKRARGAYERKYKTNRVTGRNDAERESNAMNAALTEHTAMVTAESISEVAESMEHAARISSESARKLLDKAQSMIIGQAREQAGRLKESDYRSY